MTIGERGRRARLYRHPRGAKVKGVCAGIADYIGVPPFVIRAGFVVGTIMWWWPIALYILLALILDDAPDDLFDTEEEKEFWSNVRREPKGTASDLGKAFQSINARLATMERHVTSSEFELNRKFRDL